MHNDRAYNFGMQSRRPSAAADTARYTAAAHREARD
jgi:hypothetical protein